MQNHEIVKLIEFGERHNIEFKSAVKFDTDFRPHITATIASMANCNGGGFIIIGIQDQNKEPDPNISQEILDTWEITILTKYLEERLSHIPKLIPIIFEYKEKKILCLQVFEFISEPVIIKKDLQDAKGKSFANAGDIFIRTETRETRKVRSADEMRDIINRSVIKKSSLLLEDIRRIFQGNISNSSSQENSLSQIIESISDINQNFNNSIRYNHSTFARYRLEIYLSEAKSKFEKSTDLYSVLESSVIDKTFSVFPLFFDYKQEIKQSLDFLYLDTKFQKWILHKNGYVIIYFYPWTEGSAQDMSFNYSEPPERPIFIEEVIKTLEHAITFAYKLGTVFNSSSIDITLTFENLLKRHLGSLNSIALPEECVEFKVDLLRDTYFHNDLYSNKIQIIKYAYEKLMIIFQRKDAISDATLAYIRKILKNAD
ncbi:divergent AAA domain protein [Leptospira interrogans serovar Grippotyphosa str. UI 12769]|nr:RNA-binding domain-containing protein [Leptospira interrogans]EMN84868.1 divergent AAA domain protein [Leptospira interrogans serovar Grippotyphosa str. UI 12769]